MKLFLCSATNTLMIALFDEKGVIDVFKHLGKNDHSKTLMRELDNCLKKNHTNLNEIDEILISNGPGSYTGLRIAVVVAKTLALFNNIKLYQVSSLECLASSKEGLVMPIIPAKRGMVFAAAYQVGEREIKVLQTDRYMSEEEAAKLAIDLKLEIVKEEDYLVNPLILNKMEASVYKLSPNYLREWQS